MDDSTKSHRRQTWPNMSDVAVVNSSYTPTHLIGEKSPRGRNRATFTPYSNTQVNTDRGLADMSDSPEPVELLVTNLDQRVDHNEIKKMIGNLFREHVNVVKVSVFLQTGGNISAVVKVTSRREAQFAISQLHKRKFGQKRIFISENNGSIGGPFTLSKEALMLLKSVPNGKTHLFKFREMFEERYHMSIAVSDLYKMRDIVNIFEDSTGRMIQLKHNIDMEGGLEESVAVESLYCSKHCPSEEQKGWAERTAHSPLPNVNISLKELGPNIQILVKNHNGSLPLVSLARCYEAEFGKFGTGDSVPLEHLVACVKGVEITTGVTGIKRLVESSYEVPLSVAALPPPSGWSPSPPLVTQLLRFSREVVDLLKTYPGCRMSLHKFIPDYHHHFMRQCRVADYGFTKLRELLDALPNVVQILGEGSRACITLAHRAQIKRFTSDLLKVLKSQASKQMYLSDMADLFERFTNKPFRITDYGVCDVEDLLVEISVHTVVVSSCHVLSANKVGNGQDKDSNNKDVLISLPKKEQTLEEVDQTRSFGRDVVELLGHAPDCALLFNKFIPAYHHHFGRQCRVGDYGFSKLIEVFEAIPEIVEITVDMDGERIVELVKQERVKVVGRQMVDVIQTNKKKYMPLSQISEAYTEKFGFQLRLEKFGMNSMEELLSNLQSWVKVTEGREGPLVTIVDKGVVITMTRNVRKILMEQSEGKMELVEFVQYFGDKFGSKIDVEMIRRDMSSLVTVDDKFIQLTPLQMVARNIQSILQEQEGKMTMEELDTAYVTKFGSSLKPEDYGFMSKAALLTAMPDTVDIRRWANGNNPMESTNKLTFPSSTPKTTTRMPFSHPKPSSTLSTVSFSGRGFDMIRSVAPSRITNYPPPIHQWPQNRYTNTCVPPPALHHDVILPPVPHHDAILPPVPHHNIYSQVVPTTGIYYPYHNTSMGSPVFGPTFHEHMLNHSPSPHITQGPSHLIHPTSKTSSVYPEPVMLPSVTRSVQHQMTRSPCIVVPSVQNQLTNTKQFSPDSVCEGELDKSLEKLMESVTDQVLLGTSPAPPKSPMYLPKSTSPVTPNSTCYLARSTAPPSYLARITTPPSYLARSTTPPSYLAKSTTPPIYLARSTTPPSYLARSTTPPSYLARITTPNRMKPLLTPPPHSPAYRTEYTPSAAVTNQPSSLLQVTPLLLRGPTSPRSFHQRSSKISSPAHQ